MMPGDRGACPSPHTSTRRWWAVLAAGAQWVGCAAGEPPITAEALAAHIAVLASDSFEGRGPSSPGEEKTVAYLQSAFQQMGLRPGNAGSYFQEVPLVSLTADRGMTLTVRGPVRPQPRGRGRGRAAAPVTTFRFPDDFVAFTNRVVERVGLNNSELVFVGYGVVAPELSWNDYEGIEARGKTVVILVNDPDFATGDTALFKGRAMTYYGRWTYKYEEAARQGAAGALVVHETEPAGYPWEVVTGSWGGARFGLEARDNNMSRPAVEGWITRRTAERILQRAGLRYDSLKTLASQRGFRPVRLGITASTELRNSISRSRSKNVIAVLPGSRRPEEYVIYMAHWDHLGRNPALEGDQIFNGAVDNATGTAGLLELAGSFAAGPVPARSVAFLAVTAEEQGLLGSAYYARNPVFPLAKTVAAINMDGLNVDGAMRDVTVIGYGNSELDDYLAEAARAQRRVLRPDPEPEKGFFYRSDHFELAKMGVPALYPDAGLDHVEGGEAYALERRNRYTADRYHKPADEYDPGWDLSGAVDDLKLLFQVGYRLANESGFPNWREGNEFKAKRDAMMSGTR